MQPSQTGRCPRPGSRALLTRLQRHDPAEAQLLRELVCIVGFDLFEPAVRHSRQVGIQAGNNGVGRVRYRQTIRSLRERMIPEHTATIVQRVHFGFAVRCNRCQRESIIAFMRDSDRATVDVRVVPAHQISRTFAWVGILERLITTR